LQLAQSWGYPVEERRISVKEVIEAIEEGRLTDAFGAGTAATIARIDVIISEAKITSYLKLQRVNFQIVFIRT
jgi:branched-chain amino acid aminotransferase